MAPNPQLSVGIAKQLLATGILTLPLMLAAVKYLVDDADFSTSSDIAAVNLGLMIVLGYASLMAVIVLAGNSLMDIPGPRVQASIRMLEAFTALIGVAIASLLREELPERWELHLSSVAIAFWVFFLAFVWLSIDANPLI